MVMIDVLVMSFFILWIFLTGISWIFFRGDIEGIDYLYLACIMFALSFEMTVVMGMSMYISQYISAFLG